ncbi:MAG: hypothetical protein OXN89_05765 [Bryobacterales bacterium]|nr:hypothetical protein [Bryobacterales bacterium]
MTAPKRVLSDEISGAIRGRRVTSAVFTTYSFDPAFFELEILPLLFESRVRGGFSHVEKVRRVQLEECLRGGAAIEVFYDRGGLVSNAGPASLDFRRIDVGRRTGIFHPKLVLVLVENPPSEDNEPPTQSLIVATLSANLTRAGWWENLEAGHVEVIDAASPRNWRCTFRPDLLDALGLLARAAPHENGQGALRATRRFLQESAPQYTTKNASWKGKYYTRLFVGQKPLHEWLQDRRIWGRDWNLEVVSPFFDAHGAQALRRLAEATRPGEVRVFLPLEADGTPSVTSEQYEAVETVAKWSRFATGTMRAVRRTPSEKAVPRRVHAKVYRFWRRGLGDVSLVGSANATEAAHSGANAGNLEAAFLANTTTGGDSAGWWLKRIDDPPDRFLEQSAEEDGDAERVGLSLSLRYHWERHAFEYRLGEDHNGDVRLHSIAGEELHTVVRPVRGEWEDCGLRAAGRIKNLLKSTSLVEARTGSDKGESRWRVLIREEGMTHKPSLLTQLTPDEILEYWSLLSDSQRQAFLADRLQTDEAILGIVRSPDGPPPERAHSVFDRFAGIFHAFQRLSDWIDEKLDLDRDEEVTARLFGEKYDSLPVLLRKVRQRAKDDAVTAYVTFLSAKQVVAQVCNRWPRYWAQHSHDAQKLERELEAATSIRARIPLLDPGREEFLTWYEENFVSRAADMLAEGDRDQ